MELVETRPAGNLTQSGNLPVVLTVPYHGQMLEMSPEHGHALIGGLTEVLREWVCGRPWTRQVASGFELLGAFDSFRVTYRAGGASKWRLVFGSSEELGRFMAQLQTVVPPASCVAPIQRLGGEGTHYARLTRILSRTGRV